MNLVKIYPIDSCIEVGPMDFYCK